jgi:hypothetical protein
VVSATVPVAAALLMLLPQLEGRAVSVKATVVAEFEVTVNVPSNKAPDSAVQLVPALKVPVMPETVMVLPAAKFVPDPTVSVTRREPRLKLTALNVYPGLAGNSGTAVTFTVYTVAGLVA